MAAGTPEKLHYEIFPITGTVDERGVILWVRETFFTATTSTPRGTTLANFMSTENIPKGDAITCGYGSFVYTEQLPKSGSCLRFIFLKDKTEAEILTPLRDPYEITENILWPDWLRSLYAVKGEVSTENRRGAESQIGSIAGTGSNVQVTSASSSTEEAFFDRYILIKGGNFNTITEIAEYFSPTPFPDFGATEPRPTPIYYNHKGMRNELNALHGEVTIPELMVSFERVEEFGMLNSAPVRWELGSIFPKTNMTGWESHIRSADILERDGGFYARVKTVHPPPTYKALEI